MKQKELFEEHFTYKVNEQGEKLEKPESYEDFKSSRVIF